MSDCVERWAVLELLSDRRCNTNCFDESGQKIYEALSKAIKDIQDLPSVETFEFGKWYAFQRGYEIEVTKEAYRISRW